MTFESGGLQVSIFEELLIGGDRGCKETFSNHLQVNDLVTLPYKCQLLAFCMGNWQISDPKCHCSNFLFEYLGT